MTAPALNVDNLSLAIGDTVVVDGIGFSVAQGEVMAIVGESGCGKSITAQAIMRLLPPAIRHASGTIRLGDDDITAISERAMQAIRGRRMSMIFQEPQTALDPLATIGTQIAEALRQPLYRARPGGAEDAGRCRHLRPGPPHRPASRSNSPAACASAS